MMTGKLYHQAVSKSQTRLASAGIVAPSTAHAAIKSLMETFGGNRNKAPYWAVVPD
jgi:hypothetical protein